MSSWSCIRFAVEMGEGRASHIRTACVPSIQCNGQTVDCKMGTSESIGLGQFSLHRQFANPADWLVSGLNGRWLERKKRSSGRKAPQMGIHEAAHSLDGVGVSLPSLLVSATSSHVTVDVL